MPVDEDLSADLAGVYDEVRRFFITNRNKNCVPLLLNSFGSINGSGIYQSVEKAILQFPPEDVIPHLKQALLSNEYSVRYWSVLIAAHYPSAELLPLFKYLLENEDFDIKYLVLSALVQFPVEESKPLLEEFLENEASKELRNIAKCVLSAGMQSAVYPPKKYFH